MNNDTKKNEKNGLTVVEGQNKTATLQLTGATCPSCRFAIQHVGRKISGVENIQINPVDDIITLEYSGDETSVLEIQKLVKQLGYHAEWVE